MSFTEVVSCLTLQYGLGTEGNDSPITFPPCLDGSLCRLYLKVTTAPLKAEISKGERMRVVTLRKKVRADGMNWDCTSVLSTTKLNNRVFSH